MSDAGILRDLVLIFAAAVVVVGLLRRVGVPSIAAFILTGILVGPNTLGLVGDPHKVETLAEIGVVLLLFGIGIELSLDSLRALWRSVLVGGSLQVGLTILATLAVVRALGYRLETALFLGFVIAVSSTAIVLRALRTANQLDAPHGRFTLGVLVFQDLCVVPMMLAVPVLAAGGGSLGPPLGRMLQALVLLTVVFVVARFAAPRLLEAVARTRQRELFVLVVAVICLGIAWGLSTVGISLALGAFVAGLVVADTGYRHQALSELIPFRELLTSVFFISVGMLLDPRSLVAHAVPVVSLLAAMTVGKFVLVVLAVLLMRLQLRVAIVSGMALAQSGEFSFVLLAAAGGTSLIPTDLATALPMAVILSMLLTPLLLALGPGLATRAGRLPGVTRLIDVRVAEECPEEKDELSDHVIIAGYGIAGRELARSLREAGIRSCIVDLNVENVRRAASDGGRAYFGDVTRAEVLESVGIERARAVVLLVNDPTSEEAAIRAARRVAHEVPIVVRTRFARDIPSLRAAGATSVITAEIEAAAGVTETVLRSQGVSEELIAARARSVMAIVDDA